MKKIHKNLTLSLALVTSTIFVGCGGGSSTPSIGTTGSFEFTSSDSATLFTGVTRAIDVDAVDPDGNSISYTLSGTDADKFAIDTNGVVFFKSEATEGVYHVSVTASAGGKSISQDITITVTVAVNHAPVITSSTTASVNENQTSGMTVTATDADGDALTFSIAGGVDADKVSINPNDGVVTFNTAPDFESKNSYAFKVGAMDSIDTTTKDITITIIDVDEGHAPVITTSSSIHVNENQKNAVDVDATDVDGDTITYSLEGGVDVASFDINSTTGKVSFKTAPDFESKNSYKIVVGASDMTATTTKNITIAIDDVQGGSNIVKTGQSVRYLFDDDGDLQIGLDKSFTTGGIYYKLFGITVDERTVTNNATKLQWQNNTYLQNMTYADAATYCNNLFYNYLGDWRLPTISEFYDIADRGEANPAVSDLFNNIKTDKDYWSQTKYSNNKYYTFNLKFGADTTSSDNNKRYVRCVRTDRVYKWDPLFKRFTRSGSTGNIITDNTTKLQWYDKVNQVGNTPTTGTWTQAIEGCKNLTVDGKNDWRLPNINELLTIVNHYSKSKGTTFYNIFETIEPDIYFSSTTRTTDTHRSWIVNFSYGQDGAVEKNKNYNYRCVRTLGD